MNPLFRFPTAHRPLRIETPLGSDTFALLELTGSEGLSELFSFNLRLAADRYADIEFDKLLGKFVTITIDTPELSKRLIHGLVATLAREQDDEALGYYRIDVVPQFWLWTRQRQSRIFQQQSVPDILKTVFHGLETKVELSGHYLARDYCVQYDETDYDFAARLMEEEGIFFHFAHEKDKHTLVLCDDVANLPDATLADTLLFDPDAGGRRDLPRLWNWNKSQRLVTTKFTCRDQCFELYGQSLESDTKIATDAKLGSVTHKLICRDEDQEAYSYPARTAKWFDGVAPGGGDRSADIQHIHKEKDRYVRLLAEAETAQAVVVSGISTSLAMIPAKKFLLANHGWGDGKYLVKRVEHRAQLRIPARSSEDNVSFSYQNNLEVLPDGLPYRRQLQTPRPIVQGLQTAIVTGPSGQEVFVDKYGRIKVQFPWDRQGQKNADSSCWVRVGQFWAGKRFGAFFWPRIGHEVVVAFEDGDPDRPLIVGSVYNATNMPPLTLPEDVQMTGIKSCIYGSNPLQKYNALIFHDVPGQEYVNLHSETHQMQNTKSDNFQYVPSASYEFHGSFF